MSVLRIDSASELASPRRLPNGYLRVDGYLTRAGIFPYRRGDGTVQLELRPEEEVFSKDSLESFEGVPVTNNHPEPGLLTAANTRQFQVGHVLVPVRIGQRVASAIMVTDAQAIQDLEGGKTALSGGYVCDLDHTPGIWNGQRYDAIQRRIRGNHVAIVQVGRAGPDVRVRMDTADAVMVEPPDSQILPLDKDAPVATRKIKIDSVDAEVEETTAQLIEKERAKQDAAVSAARTELEQTKARADAADAELKKVKEQLAAAPAKAREEINARIKLETRARDVLGAEAKFDALTDRQVQLEVLKKLDAEFAADEKVSDTYVEARFDASVGFWQKQNPGQAELRELARQDAATTPAGGKTVAQLEAEYKERNRNAYQRPDRRIQDNE